MLIVDWAVSLAYKPLLPPVANLFQCANTGRPLESLLRDVTFT